MVVARGRNGLSHPLPVLALKNVSGIGGRERGVAAPLHLSRPHDNGVCCYQSGLQVRSILDRQYVVQKPKLTPSARSFRTKGLEYYSSVAPHS